MSLRANSRAAREGTTKVGLFAHGHTHSRNPTGGGAALEDTWSMVRNKGLA